MGHAPQAHPGRGGGSTDFAAVLAALNAMTGRPLGREELLRLAAGLGSNVRFVFSGGEAWVCRTLPANPIRATLA